MNLTKAGLGMIDGAIAHFTDLMPLLKLEEEEIIKEAIYNLKQVILKILGTKLTNPQTELVLLEEIPKMELNFSPNLFDKRMIKNATNPLENVVNIVHNISIYLTDENKNKFFTSLPRQTLMLLITQIIANNLKLHEREKKLQPIRRFARITRNS